MKKLFLLLFCALNSIVIYSQVSDRGVYLEPDTVMSLRHYRFGDNWFMGVHAGVSGSMSENIRPRDYFFHVQRPAFALSVGKFFSPSFGLRCMGTFSWQRSKAEKEAVACYPEAYGDGYYDFNIWSMHLDAMANLSNIFYPYNENRRFNVLGFIGVGFDSSFNFEEDKLDRWRNLPNGPYDVSPGHHTYLSVLAGLGFSYQLNECFDLDLDLYINATDDGLNGVRYDDKYDGYTYALLGLKYHFGDQYDDHRFKYTRMADILLVDDANARINQARQELEEAGRPKDPNVSQERLLEMTISFNRDKFNITEVQRPNVEMVASFIKAHPEFDVVICGFADVKTAYPAYNMRLSKRRVMAVYNMLTKQYGIDPQRLSIDYKGDIEQPYRVKNEWNRVVVFKLTPHNEYKFLE